MATPDTVKAAVFADSVRGVTIPNIAKRYAISERTVSNIVSKIRKDIPQVQERAVNAESVRAKLSRAAVDAVDAGLQCPDDPYKRGSLGVAVLKGTGVFNSGEHGGTYNTLIMGMPAEWRERYEAIDTEAGPSE